MRPRAAPSLAGWALARRILDNPILIVGPGRSGTTALRRALQQHPAIVTADGESPFIAQIARLIDSFENWPSRSYHRAALKLPVDEVHRDLRRLSFEAALGPHFGLRRLVRELVRARSTPWSWHRWCAKTFPDSTESRCLIQLYPNVRFIQVVRDGCAVINSRQHWPAMSHLSFEEHCQAWASSIERFCHLSSLEVCTTVRHEDLLQDPEGTLSSLLAWLGLSPDERPATFARTTVVHPLDQRKSSQGDPVSVLTSRPPPYHDWSHEERETFRRICGRAMDTAGYVLPF